MSAHAFDPNCPDCRPVLKDEKTGEILPDNHPKTIAALKVWFSASRKEQEAFYSVVVLKSRNPMDIITVKGLADRIWHAVKLTMN